MTIDPSNPANLPNIVPEHDALTLLGIIREDISKAVVPVMTENDKYCYVLVSVIENAVFVSCIIEDKENNHRFGEVELHTVLELWELKKKQAAPDKGAWFDIQFRAEEDGFITKISYNYDQPVYRGTTPDEWHLAPGEDADEDYQALWTLEQYQAELVDFPRHAENIPDWLK